MGQPHKLQGYLEILVERAARWRDAGVKLLNSLENSQYETLLSSVEHRQKIIDSYQECLQKCVDELRCAGYEFEDEKILPFLLDLTHTEPEFESFEEDLLQVRGLIEETREQERDLLRMVSELPATIRQKLLNVQTQKTGISAYQKNQAAPLAQFSRFERKK